MHALHAATVGKKAGVLSLPGLEWSANCGELTLKYTAKGR